jgi:Autotransporter beta-domain
MHSIMAKCLVLGGLAGFLLLGHSAEVRAQTALCPPGFSLTNGSCVKGDDGAFSGAALSSQALSELSQTITQQTTTNTVKSVTERREQEQQRRRPPSAPHVAPPAVPPPPAYRPSEAYEPSEAKAESAARQRYPSAAPAPGIVYERQPEPTPGPSPAPIEPAIRFGTWAQIYGDYEKRDAAGPGVVSCCTVVGLGALNIDPNLSLSIQSRTSTVGFLAGADLTSRDLFFGNDGLIAGITAGYVSSDLSLSTSALSSNLGNKGGGSSHLSGDLSGPTVGLFATYFNGGFSTDSILKFDVLDLKETFNDFLVTTAGNNPPTTVPHRGGGSASLLNTTIAGNLNYRFDLSPNLWIEPTVGAQYTHSSYGSNASQLGLADGDLGRIQGGARFGVTTLIDNRIPLTTILTGLAYDDFSVSGGFIPAAAFNGNNLLAHSDEGRLRGRGILAFALDLGQGVTSFVQGEVRGGQGLFGAGGRAGIRVQW